MSDQPTPEEKQFERDNPQLDAPKESVKPLLYGLLAFLGVLIWFGAYVGKILGWWGDDGKSRLVWHLSVKHGATIDK